MACCGGGGSRPLRVQRQVVSRSEKKKAKEPVVQQRVRQRSTVPHVATAASIPRQYAVPRTQCTKCGYPTMVVHIAGRERTQCSNANCRTIIQ